MNTERDDLHKAQKVHNAIQEAEGLAVALDATVAELVEMLRSFSERSSRRAT